MVTDDAAKRREEIAALIAALRSRVDDLARALLGEPNRAMSTKRELRFGSKGALCIWIAGTKRGGWADFSGDAKGTPLGLIRYARQCSFPEAKAWARAWLGWPDEAEGGAVRQLPSEPPPANEAPTDDAADAERRAEIARRFWHDSEPVRGTVGERYLVEQRKIPAPLRGWPEAVRFHRSSRSLILAATTAEGMVRAVQMVRLTSSARVVLRDDGGKLKITRGAFAGVAVRLPSHQAAGALLLAEGPETGLSVWRATGCETWVFCGSMSRADVDMLPRERMVIVCADDDLQNHPDPRKVAAARALAKAVREWRAAGVWLAVATPSVERRQDKSDFNDLLQVAGPAAVRARLVTVAETMAAERRRHIAERIIPRAIGGLLAAGRKSNEIFAAAIAANAEAGGWLTQPEVVAACGAARHRQERANAKRHRRRAA